MSAGTGERRRLWLLGFGLLVVLAGCLSAPPSPVVPGSFDLSGSWLLVPGSSDEAPTTNELRARGGMLHLIASDFPVLRARAMHIEQDRQSMGINYDGGTYRDVSWGARSRGLWEIEAGWLDDELVIRSRAEDADAEERYRLDADGRLVVTVDLRSGRDHIYVVRTFQRGAI